MSGFNRHRRVFATLLLVIMSALALACPLVAFADGPTDGAPVVIPQADAQRMVDAMTGMAEKYKSATGYIQVEGGSNGPWSVCAQTADKAKITPSSTNAVIWVSSGGTEVQFSSTNFNNATDKGKQEVVSCFASALSKAGVSQSTVQNIGDALVENSPDMQQYLIATAFTDMNGDVWTAMRFMAPILQLLRVVIGIGAILLILFLFASTVIDCVYIGLPMAREAMDARSANGGGGQGYAGWVSAEARAAVQETESAITNSSGGGYKNAYLAYMKKRVVTYIVLAVCILYLIAGEIGGLVQGFLNLASGAI